MSRASQPYRKGSSLRLPGMALTAMKRGRTATGFNPKDLERNMDMMRRAKARARPQRPPRPDRPPRPQR
jgi:hypothetical protein